MTHLKTKIKKQFTSEFGARFLHTKDELQFVLKFLDEAVEETLDEVREILKERYTERGHSDEITFIKGLNQARRDIFNDLKDL